MFLGFFLCVEKVLGHYDEILFQAELFILALYQINPV